MNKWGVFLSACFALVLMLGAASASAAQPNYGFAAYQVSTRSPGGVHSALINETVGPAPKAGYSDLVLQVFGGQQNLTYSRLVNASYDLLPYFPSLGTQSLDYENATQFTNGTLHSIHLSVSTGGSVTRTFGASQYSLSVSTVAVSGTYGSRSFSINGTVETFPSQLVYSVNLGNSTYGVQATLQATSLPLDPASSVSSTAVYAGAGIGVGALSLGGVLLVRRRAKKVETSGEKPLHWVD